MPTVVHGDFEWDEAKAASNVAKHGVSFEEAARGAYTPHVDPDVLAYAIVRIGEAFLYNDAIIALEPNVEQACAVVRLLLD